MDDLLKNAIADAKAVRETALVNAKLALEEAFTPKIQSMLSKKIQSETEGETEEGEEVPAEEEEEYEEEEVPAEEEEVPAEEEGDEVSSEEPAVDAGGEEGGEDAAEKDVDVEVGDDDDEDLDDEEEAEEGEYEEDLDLEAIIRELEGEEAEEGEDEVSEEEEAEEDEEAVEEQSDSSNIGSGDNKVDVADSGDEEDPQGAGVKSDSMDETLDIELSEEEEAEEGEDVEENIDLEEILKSLSEDEEAEEGEEVEEVTQLKSDLGEHRKVIKFLRSKLNEVNLLNAKLLFTNKLFKAFNLNNDEKLKVVETFDRANNLREVKLVYSTLAESYGYAGGVSRIPKVKISEGSASKPVASTKPKKVISEGDDLANRFKKLAGLND